MKILHDFSWVKPLTSHSPTETLGRDLRVLRKQRGLTLSEVAAKVGRSVGWLSQVERNLSEPTTQELEHLAKVLGVSLSTFFGRAPSKPGEEDRIVRKGARRPIGRRVDGLVEELLSPDLTDDFEMLHSTFAPGASRTEKVSRPTQEVGYVVSGTLDVSIGDDTFTVSPGDSFRIRGEALRWANRTTEPCVVIWVIAPPVY